MNKNFEFEDMNFGVNFKVNSKNLSFFEKFYLNIITHQRFTVMLLFLIKIKKILEVIF